MTITINFIFMKNMIKNGIERISKWHLVKKEVIGLVATS